MLLTGMLLMVCSRWATPTTIKKGYKELYGGVHTDTYTDIDAIGFQTHCVGAGISKGKICVGVKQCEHTIRVHLYIRAKATLLPTSCIVSFLCVYTTATAVATKIKEKNHFRFRSRVPRHGCSRSILAVTQF